MRTETLWQGERRAARTHWWRLVLDPTAGSVDRKVLFDEELTQRFWLPEDTHVSRGEGHAVTPC